MLRRCVLNGSDTKAILKNTFHFTAFLEESTITKGSTTC